MKKLNPKRNWNKLIVAFLILFISITSFYIYSSYKEKYLIDNGTITKAIVKNIIHNNYRMNDVDIANVDNYIIEYEFTIDKERIKAIGEVNGKEYKMYFKNPLKLNDTIRVLYNPNNPNENKIIKMK